MGLTNPLLGVIPVPKEEKSEVFNPLVRGTNYGAQLITQQRKTAPFIETLQIDDTGGGTVSDTYDTAAPIILNMIIVQGFFERPNSTEECALDVIIGATTLVSLNYNLNYDAGDPEANKQVPFSIIIPLDSVSIGTKTRLTLTATKTNGRSCYNASFIGNYEILY